MPICTPVYTPAREFDDKNNFKHGYFCVTLKPYMLLGCIIFPATHRLLYVTDCLPLWLHIEQVGCLPSYALCCLMIHRSIKPHSTYDLALTSMIFQKGPNFFFSQMMTICYSLSLETRDSDPEHILSRLSEAKSQAGLWLGSFLHGGILFLLYHATSGSADCWNFLFCVQSMVLVSHGAVKLERHVLLSCSRKLKLAKHALT